MTTLLLAEKWHIPPWEVEAALQDERGVWMWRQHAWDDARSTKEKAVAQHETARQSAMRSTR